MYDYVSFLLEANAAKRRLARLFEQEARSSVNYLSPAIVPSDPSRAACTSADENDTMPRELRRTQSYVRDRKNTAIPAYYSAENKRDLTNSGFMLALVFVGVILAAQTDEPEFWLLIGAGPFARLNTIGIFFRKRLKRRDGLLVFCERDR